MKSHTSTWWRRQADLDQQQKSAIELSINGNHCVYGPPGSGKTNILILRAQYISSAGLQNTRLLVYTRVLREFIASGCGDTVNFPANQVQTFAGWANEFIKGRGGATNFSESMEREARLERLAALKDAITGVREDYFDSLLVDEAQDLWPDEIDILRRLSMNLFFAGDNKQKIFDGNGINHVKTFTTSRVELTRHYRIAPEICSVADRLKVEGSSDEMAASEHYQDRQYPGKVVTHQGLSFEDQVKRAASLIRTQIKAYPGDWIGIIVNRKELRDRVSAILSKAGLGTSCRVLSSQRGQQAFSTAQPVCIMTLQGAKGTEFRAVHWLGADDVPYYSREKAFTVVTRAKTALDVYADGQIHPEVRAALAPRQAPRLGLPE